MSRDPLAEAARALREGADASPARPDETRARVLASLQNESKARARRIPLIRMAIPLAAVLVGSMAWAAAGGHLPTSFRAVFPGSPGSVTSPEASPPPSVLSSSAPPIPVTDPPESAEKPLDSPTIPQEPAPRALELPRTPRKATSIPVASAAAVAPISAAPPAPVITAPAPVTPADPDEQALYAAAHRLHFVEHNPGAAPGAWNTYLRAAPRGRLSVEAHYNRALCLVRLGRAAEAEAGLQSFARGAYGGYRQAEARALHGAQP